MIKLLLVEDDRNLSYMIKGSLEDMIGGYEVITAYNGVEGIAMWKEHKPDIIIADVDMPEMNGFEMVKKIREADKSTLILFASGRVSSKDVTSSFQIGGNNYVKKPFIPEELDAHIKGMFKLRNELLIRDESEITKVGTHFFDAIHGTLKNDNGINESLTVREAQVMRLLVSNKGEIVKRETILEHCWDVKEKDYFTSRSLDVFIAGLRKKLANVSARIETVRGVGLRLVDESIPN